MINTLLKKLKEIDICMDTSVIVFLLDNELDSIVLHSRLVVLFKDQDLELFFQIPHPKNKKKSKIDIGIFSMTTHEHICVKEVEIENAAALFSKLLYLKSHMNGFIQNQDPKELSLFLGSTENGSREPITNSFIKLKKLTIVSTPGGSEILRIPEVNS